MKATLTVTCPVAEAAEVALHDLSIETVTGVPVKPGLGAAVWARVTTWADV